MHADMGHDPSACPACGAANPAVARFCRQCGSVLRESVPGGVSLRSATRLTPLLRQWRLMKANLTRKEVRKLLGEPLRVEPADPLDALSTERWTYAYEPCETQQSSPPVAARVTGAVCFAPDGRLVGWIEPDWAMLAGDGFD